MDKSAIDILWITICTMFVLLMQAGFLCLESGLTRSKNNINVAIKNIADIGVSIFLFWVLGYGLVYGVSQWGWFGTTGFMPDGGKEQSWFISFFLFQAMFCCTAVTLIAGAIAERVRFNGYIILASLVAGVIYPLFAHWSWNGANNGALSGWLGARGFVDFAGACVVHSLGGWVALAVLLVIGPRTGRFPKGKPSEKISGANLPLAMLGVILLLFGWFGFNGGNTLSMNNQVPKIIQNTLLSGAAGVLTALAMGWLIRGQGEVMWMMNGLLAALVAVTANAHAVSALSAVIIGGVGCLVMLGAERLLEHFHIDDAIGAIPVHLGAGIWGTLAVALFGEASLLNTGLSFPAQLNIQLTGIIICGFWAFGATYFLVKTINRFFPLRVSPEAELVGLNISQHGAGTELVDLFHVMDQQARSHDLSLRLPVEPFTEVGRIAERYNQVMSALENSKARNRTIVNSAVDGIITFTKTGLLIDALNPAAEAMFGYENEQVRWQPITLLLKSSFEKEDQPAPALAPIFTKMAAEGLCSEMEGVSADGSPFPVEVMITEEQSEDESFFIGTFRNITRRKQVEKELRQYRESLEEQISKRTIDLKRANGQLQREVSERKRAEKDSHRLRNYLSNIIDSMPSMVIGVDPEGLITQWNQKAERATGLSLKDAMGQHFEKAIPRLSMEMGRIREAIQSRREQNDPKLARQEKGETLYEDVTIYPLVANGVEGAVIRVDDVTERIRLEEMMLQSEKMLSIGGLAAGMAHEINNPLAGMMQTASILASRLGEKIDMPANRKAAEEAGISVEAIGNFMTHRGIPRMIATINESGRRVAEIVNNMLSFARKGEALALPQDIGKLLDKTLKLAATDYDFKKCYDFKLIRIKKEYEENLPSAPCAGPKIQQVFLNILRNASQAMHEARTKNPLFILRTRFEKREKMVCIEIEDNGPGMDEEVRKRVFEPFFTTKPVGVGTGLGLSVSYFIITENHRGRIAVESRPGSGSKFIIRLPLEKNADIQP